jgi:uroporphyrinogen decarboxylase
LSRPLLDALACRPLDRPPVWIMRQAGRYLPEYRAVREKHPFQEMVATPELAAEVTLQPIRRFGMDGAVIFADIMTPLEAMGVEIVYDPGPKLKPLTLSEIVELPELDPERVSHVAATVELVRESAPNETAVIGFAGAPVTLLAYLFEGGGSKDFMTMRAAAREQPEMISVALGRLAASMQTYLQVQIDSGADVVQLFDTWAGLFDRDLFTRVAVPAARQSLLGLEAPSIYFAPGAGHTLDLQKGVGATGYGVDWRTDIETAFSVFADSPVQGNLDPAVLRGSPAGIRDQVGSLLARAGSRSGHIVNLGHGIDRHTPPENVAVFVEAVRS